MARSLSKEASMATTGNALGPLKWMAPESIRVQQYSGKSDVWMFGVVMIEIFTRSEPWPDKSTTEVGTLVTQKNESHPIPTEMPDGMKECVVGCFQLEPKSRPDASQLSISIQELLKKAK